MKCPNCGGTEYAYACEDENGKMPIKCPWCGYSEVTTNEEWLQQATTEQKAEAIFECVMANSWNFSKNGIKRWLKQPHQEE